MQHACYDVFILKKIKILPFILGPRIMKKRKKKWDEATAMNEEINSQLMYEQHYITTNLFLGVN